MEKIINIAIILMIVTGLAVASVGIGKLCRIHRRASDAFIRNRVVKLINPNKGYCSGVEIEAPSHKVYVLTAAHCRSLVENGNIIAENEQKQRMQLSFVAESDKYDLMLLQGGFPVLPAIPIAKSVRIHEHVHSITHGGAQDTERQDGEMLNDAHMEFVESEITNDDELKACSGAKHFPIQSWFGNLCILSETVELSTTRAMPGSSGGPLLNDRGELVGIVSGGDSEALYDGYVRLSDIQDFMKDR